MLVSGDGVRVGAPEQEKYFSQSKLACEASFLARLIGRKCSGVQEAKIRKGKLFLEIFAFEACLSGLFRDS